METKNNFQPLSNTEIASFCNQMALILHSGISFLEGISIMLEDAKSKDEKAILQAIYDELLMTGSLHTALSESGVFPSYLLNMVEIGEFSGELDEVMDSLCAHYEREESISSAIRNAITYPLVMITMMLVVVLILIVKVLPIFQQVFRQLGREMTGFSGGLMNIGTMISRYSIVLIIAIAIVAGFVFFLCKTENGRKTLIQVAAKIKLTRSLSEKMAACRFASAMSLMLSSGLTPEQSLEMAVKLTENPDFEKKTQRCMELLAEGNDLADILHETGIFSGLYSRMITVGSKTGSMDEVMQKIAVQYEEEIDQKLSGMIAILEPTLVAVLSIIVGMILLSVMLPLLGILSGF